jgi:2-oxoglutarate ferredoxin oxidoreductase subunit beta
VFVSGIGCSSRFPYYMNTYGFHSIHGRAPAIASGLKVSRPELSVWVITGDGDGLSIGGNHLLHLTKGQYSPTSTVGTRAPSTPMGSIDYPVNPLQVAIGAGATFVARAIDVDAKRLGPLLARAQAHNGGAFIEVLQNCPVFNDGVWEPITDKGTAEERQLHLEHGQPLVFDGGKRGIRLRPDFTAEVVEVGDGPGQVPLSDIHVHDERAAPGYAFLLSQLSHPEMPMPFGVLRVEDKATYDQLATEQVAAAVAKKGKGKLENLLKAGMTWKVD